MKPTGSKGKLPWKGKNATRGSRAGATSADAVSGGEAITEEYVVTKVKVAMPVSSKQTTAPREDDGYGNSSSSCREEIESLKGAVRDLTSQLKKQNEAIRKQEGAIKKQNEASKKQNEEIKKQDEAVKKLNDGIAEMKSFVGNIGLTLITYGKDGENKDDSHLHDARNSQRSPEQNSGSTAENSLIDNANRTGDPIDEPPEQISENDNMNTDGEDNDDSEDCSNMFDSESEEDQGSDDQQNDHFGNAFKRRKLITVTLCKCGRHRGYGAICSHCKQLLENPIWPAR